MLGKNRVEERNGEFGERSTSSVHNTASSGARTVIGEQITIEGGITGNEDLVIEGSVKGKIEVPRNHLTVGQKGRVEAEVHAGNVTISGRLTGNIHATGKVEITKGANFNGEIKAKSISVEDGAFLKAVIELEQESQKGVSPLSKPWDNTDEKGDKEPLTLVAGAEKRK